MIKAEQVPETVWVQVALRLESCGAVVSNDVAKLVAAETINAWPGMMIKLDGRYALLPLTAKTINKETENG